MLVSFYFQVIKPNKHKYKQNNIKTMKQMIQNYLVSIKMSIYNILRFLAEGTT